MQYISELNIDICGEPLGSLVPGSFINEMDLGEMAFENNISRYYNEGAIVSHNPSPREITLTFYVPGKWKTIKGQSGWVNDGISKIVHKFEVAGKYAYLGVNGFRAYGKLQSLAIAESIHRGRMRLYELVFECPTGYWEYGDGAAKESPGISGNMLHFPVAFPVDDPIPFSMRSKTVFSVTEGNFVSVRDVMLAVYYDPHSTAVKDGRVTVTKVVQDGYNTEVYELVGHLANSDSYGVWGVFRMEINLSRMTVTGLGGSPYLTGDYITVNPGDVLTVKVEVKTGASGDIYEDVTTESRINFTYKPLYSMPDLGDVEE